MEYIFNVKKIKDAGLTPDSFYYLLSLSLEQENEFGIPSKEILAYLQKEGWIKIGEDKVHLRGKFETTFKSYVESGKVSEWINEWRALWPSNIKSAGRPARGSKQGCLNKMKVYMKKNPSITKERIFEVTKAYLFEKKRSNYSFLTCADYFIDKDGVSLLDSFIEHYKDKETVFEANSNPSSFHKEI